MLRPEQANPPKPVADHLPVLLRLSAQHQPKGLLQGHHLPLLRELLQRRQPADLQLWRYQLGQDLHHAGHQRRAGPDSKDSRLLVRLPEGNTE